MFFTKKTGPVDWLLVCLGNPGDKYDYTRHNIGFLVADHLAEEHGVSLKKIKFRSHIAEISLGEQRVLLMKPLTYMNLSGEAVIEALHYYKVPRERVLVISDEVAFPVGKMKIGLKGSAGGHNGLKNIIALLHTQDFPRIRVGVGQKPHPDYDMADWVLGKFSKEDKIETVVAEVAAAVDCCLTEGFDTAMARYHGSQNTKKKPKTVESTVNPEGGA